MAKKGLDGISSLWREYKKTKDVMIRNRLVEEYLPLVKYQAQRLKTKLPDSVDLNDLMADGFFGLVEAIDGFNPSVTKFETYCVHRVRGAMLDGLRKMDWVPRLIRLRIKQYQQVLRAQGNGHLPTAQEIAKYFDISLEDAKSIEENGKHHVINLCSMEFVPRGEEEENKFHPGRIDQNQIPDPKALRPEDELSKKAGGAGFQELISCLSEEEQIIVTLYHRDDYEMWKIGEILGLSESRISQMHSDALQKIKDSLTL